ncbi:hypothetical protein [Phenylobacterium sp.]|uniref:hypothetical protein n=1 Tax=Phenylobacterium sp. TaxID=1871053 RepID=UPI001201836B|nr:hypothetical protein [Phenylobacterium sp.]THD61596.1 MAG: hypothetical protein E8A49_11535 [Phenylobacterium sp.]
MHLPAITVSMAASLIAVLAATSSIWSLALRRRQGRKAIEARLAGLGETVVEISNKPFYRAAWGTAGLTAGAVIHRIVSRTAVGEERVREWAFDPAASGGLKTFAHGIWIPLA